ncbi:MAG: metalloregulator ArsR/SmtB family transcription factor [Planctomycetales bacterium]|nr:metalloregulator ArsR/SmtB family transcription factor [Planctomycetales bacterium]
MNPTLKHEFKSSLFEQFARVGRAVASSHRLRVLDVLAQSERTVEEIAGEIGTSVANASRHLQVLRSARLVETRRAGLFIFYRLADDSVIRLWQAIREVAEVRYAELEQVVHTYLKDRETMQSVDANELQRLIREGDVSVLDVRSVGEYVSGHIPTSRSIPVDELQRRLRELPQRSRIVAYCRGPYCVFADEAVALLQRKGFNAARLSVGFPDWKLLGHPVETGEPRNPIVGAVRRRPGSRRSVKKT